MDTLSKKYYTVGEVTQMLSLPAPTLRYWEKRFPGLRPQRSVGRHRLYTPADIEQLKVINYLVHTKGLRIESAIRQLRTNRLSVERTASVVERLTLVRDRLQQLARALEVSR